MPQLLPPVCMCPLSESNQYLSKKHILDFKKCLGNQGAERSFCISFFLSLVTCPKPQTDSPRKQKLGDNLGKGSKSRAHAPPVWVTCLSPSLSLWFCCIRASTWGKAVCDRNIWRTRPPKSQCPMWASKRSRYCSMNKVQWCLLLLFTKSRSC